MTKTVKASSWSVLQVEHKMQSSEVGSQLHLTLEKTPKMLGCLRHEWASSCFIVSFKLETNDQILVHKVNTLCQLQLHPILFSALPWVPIIVEYLYVLLR
jgi:hypothetical protein